MQGFAGLFLAIAVVFALASLSGAALPEGEIAAMHLLRGKYISEMAVKGALLDAVYFGSLEGETNYAKKTAAGIEADLKDEVESAAYGRLVAAGKNMENIGGWKIGVWCGLPKSDAGACPSCMGIESPLCRGAFSADVLGRKIAIGDIATVVGFDMTGSGGEASAYIPIGTEVGY